MKILFGVAESWGWLKRKKNIGVPKKIAILFLKNLGIGDLVMLSPIFISLSNIFPQSEISIIFWGEPIFDLDKIKFITPIEFKKIKKEFDLIISPTVCLRHFSYIFSANRWFGYFSFPQLQANFPIKKEKYNIKEGHYLIRGQKLVQVIDEKMGQNMKRAMAENKVIYPNLKTQEPVFFRSNLAGRPYLAIAPVSKSPDRQWPLENFITVVDWLYENKKIEKVVFLGDRSEWDRNFIDALIRDLEKTIPHEDIFSAAGQNTLAETIFIIQKSAIFIGLDSAPAHFAYLVATKVLAIFINVDPMWRLPFRLLGNKIATIHPDDSRYLCYTGLGRADKEKCQKLARTISAEKVIEKIKELMTI